MKLVIYSNGFFETNFQASKIEDNVDCVGWGTHNISRYHYLLEKTSSCKRKYELEKGDERLEECIEQQKDEALTLVNNESITHSDFRDRCEQLEAILNFIGDAKEGIVSFAHGYNYIEYADETSHGCQAKYVLDYGMVHQEIPVKIGQPLEYRLNLNNFTFELVIKDEH